MTKKFPEIKMQKLWWIELTSWGYYGANYYVIVRGKSKKNAGIKARTKWKRLTKGIKVDQWPTSDVGEEIELKFDKQGISNFICVQW